ncbi:MAG: 3-hydroxyacyl-CoA dehydrogenase NAD-binding domain-containing protein [Steroidobacteraceae bacterium]
MSSVHFEVSGSGAVALLRLDNPPVNSLGHELRRSIVEALARAEDDPAVKAVVLIGSGKGFSGGADIREFGTPRSLAAPNLHSLLRTIEDCTKPVIAAIDGICMGGGLELALSCHYRIAAASARVALPEVKLGLLPGAGGTQRLPRLIGAEAALNMIVSGTTMSPDKLRGTPLFDAVAEGDLTTFALEFARAVVAERRGIKRVRDLAIRLPNAEAYFQFARNMVKSKAGPYPAPLACVEAVAAAVQQPFEAGMRRERELFVGLMATPESAALRHVFQAERAASHIKGLPDSVATRPINRVGVVGAGTMGGGIAMSFLNAGLPVTLLETTQEALDRGLLNIRRNYQGALRKGSLTEASLEQRLGLITPTLQYEPLRDADLVVEAVFEDLAVKRKVFERLDEVVKSGAILASNTSTLDLDAIARFTQRPQDVIGLHFFSPANIMRLLEVVRGAATANDTLATAMALAKTIGKIAVVAGVCDGFIGNRMVAHYGTAAHDLLVAGALPQQIDAALQSFGMAMGPFRMADLAGLDIGWAVRKRRAAEHPNEDFANVADILCEAGRFGQKTGSGFYRYETGAREAIPDPAVTAIIERYRESKGAVPRAVSDSEIVERCIYALINEGARIVDEGIAQRSSDVDLVYLNGYGFPAYRGGPMFYGDSVGLITVARALSRIAAERGANAAFWTPAPLLARLARERKTFSELTRPSSD